MEMYFLREGELTKRAISFSFRLVRGENRQEGLCGLKVRLKGIVWDVTDKNNKAKDGDDNTFFVLLKKIRREG